MCVGVCVGVFMSVKNKYKYVIIEVYQIIIRFLK